METRIKYCEFCKKITNHAVDTEGILLDECETCGELSEPKFY